MTTVLFFIIKVFLAAIMIVAALIGLAITLPGTLVIRLWVSLKKYYRFDTFIKQ